MSKKIQIKQQKIRESLASLNKNFEECFKPYYFNSSLFSKLNKKLEKIKIRASEILPNEEFRELFYF